MHSTTDGAVPIRPLSYAGGGPNLHHLVLCKCRRNIQYVDKQTLGIAVNGLGPCRAGPVVCPDPGAWSWAGYQVQDDSPVGRGARPHVPGSPPGSRRTPRSLPRGFGPREPGEAGPAVVTASDRSVPCPGPNVLVADPDRPRTGSLSSGNPPSTTAWAFGYQMHRKHGCRL